MIKKPRKIWEKGTPLSEAWCTWATEENHKKLNENEEINFIELSESTKLVDRLRQLSIGISKFKNVQKDQVEAESNMKQDLVELLTEQDLFAFGYPVLPKAERTPRLISSEFWNNAEIIWEHGIANDAVFKFQRINIISPEDFPELILKPKIGRKSYKDLIYTAIKELEKTTSDFENYTNKNKINCIWDYLNIHNFELNRDSRGIKDDTLRKIISSYYKK